MNIDLEPFIKVGVFGFYENISSYSDWDFEITKCNDITNWDAYKLRQIGIELYTENSKIVSIACRNKLYYNGINIIGMNIDSFKKEFSLNQTGETDKIYVDVDDDYQDVIDFDEIGLQVWLKENIIVTVFCSPNLD